MHIILLSGGSGTRLWPLSNEARSKQFLKLLPDESDGLQSMAQRVYGQILAANLGVSSITVATSEIQADAIRSQLGMDISIVTEPERRNTYPAIVLACAYLSYEKNVALDEPVVVLPVDPYTEDSYFKTLLQLAELVKQNKFNVALMGVKPTIPTSKYGYILPDGSFAEKPEYDKAKSLIKSGALWNCGVFAFKLGYAIDILNRAITVNSFSELRSRYEELSINSFDYEVLETESSIGIVPFNGQWKDLGTWNTFTEQMGSEQLGRVVSDNGCTNTHIINELDIPLIVSGIRNAVISASPDGILVADKFLSSNIKPLVEQVSQRPMYEERRWGEYKVLDYVAHSNGTKVLTKRLTILAGKSISYQIHRFRSEVWTISDGEGEFLLDDVKCNVYTGDVLQIPIGAKHAIRGIRDIEIIEVQIGSELEESDVERLAMEW
jgi:mannose-1-phosphate guanylyltransferase